MEQFVDLRPEAAPTRRPRRVATRRAAVERQPQFVRSEARRNTDMASRIAATPAPRPMADSAQERLMTLGLRASIGAAMLGMSLFFHAQLGAALASLLS